LDKTERTGSYGIELWFRNEQGERMMVHIMKDGNIAIGTKTYDYIKDEENKVIRHEYSDSERKYYKITSGDLDIEDIQKIIDKIE
jgi:glycine cleavage system aminomethyltransferase T